MATPPSGRSVLLLRAAAALTTLLVGSAGVLALSPSAPAAPPADWRGPVPTAAARPGPGHAQIVGVVTDQAAHAVDNIAVHAYRVVHGSRAKVPAASDLTYEGPGHHHGFYRLHVPAGKYVVVFTSGPHARTTYRSQKYTRVVAAGSRKVVWLKTIAMMLTEPAAARLTFAVDRAAASPGRHGTARLSVTSRWVRTVLGTVQVMESGRHGTMSRLVTGHLTRGSHGRLLLRLPRLDVGRHVLVAKYLGAVNLEAATARLVVTVER